VQPDSEHDALRVRREVGLARNQHLTSLAIKRREQLLEHHDRAGLVAHDHLDPLGLLELGPTELVDQHVDAVAERHRPALARTRSPRSSREDRSSEVRNTCAILAMRCREAALARKHVPLDRGRSFAWDTTRRVSSTGARCHGCRHHA